MDACNVVKTGWLPVTEKYVLENRRYELGKTNLCRKKEERTLAVEWHEKVSAEASWNDEMEEEDEGSTFCSPKI